MINKNMLTLLVTQKEMPTLSLESFLATKPGVLGLMGWQRIAEDHAKQVRQKQSAETSSAERRTGLAKLTALRIEKARDSVTDEDIDETLKEADQPDQTVVLPKKNEGAILQAQATIEKLDFLKSELTDTFYKSTIEKVLDPATPPKSFRAMDLTPLKTQGTVVSKANWDDIRAKYSVANAGVDEPTSIQIVEWVKAQLPD